MRVIGVDPGLAVIGIGIVEYNGDKLRFVHADTIKTKKNEPLHLRLLQIYDNLCKYCEQYLPDGLALEEVFFYRNSKSAMSVGRVEGVILTVTAKHGLKIFYYAPQEVKRKLVGFGRAKKAQIQQSVVTFLNITKLPQQHVSDALAVAICHLLTTKYPERVGFEPT